MGKKFRHFVFLTAASVAGLHAINKVINYTASLKYQFCCPGMRQEILNLPD